MSNISELSYITMRICAVDKNQSVSYGTGFLFSFFPENNPAPNRIALVLVTNRHMVEGFDKAFLRFNLADETGMPVEGKYEQVTFNDFERNSIFHPDPNVDLAIVPLAQTIKKHKGLYLYFFNEDNIPVADELTDVFPADEIIMVGYPCGIADVKNNLPVFRNGTLATSPNIDYEGEKNFLIDAACFPGSSGSPVLLRDRTARLEGHKIFFGKQNFLLGIQSAVFTYDASGEIKIVDIPTKLKPRVQTQIPSNLGIVVKSACILDFKQFISDDD